MKLAFFTLIASAKALSYDTLFRIDNADQRVSIDLAKLVPMGDVDPEECRSICFNSTWCIAYSHDDCALVVDRSVTRTERFDRQHENNFGFDFLGPERGTNILNLDGRAFKVHVGFGLTGTERIDPRRIIGAHINPMLKIDEFNSRSSVFTGFAKSPILQFDSATGHVVADRAFGGITPGFYNYPANGIKLVDGELRLSLLETLKCANHTALPAVDMRYSFHRQFFSIKSHLNDQKLHCSVTNDDDAQNCRFHSDGNTLKWSLVALRHEPGSGHKTHVVGAFDFSTGQHRGYLDRSQCHTQNSPVRLLHTGRKDGQGLHCGVGKWGFTPSTGGIYELEYGSSGRNYLMDGSHSTICDLTKGGCFSNSPSGLRIDSDDFVDFSRVLSLKFTDGKFVKCNFLNCTRHDTQDQVFTLEWNYNHKPESPDSFGNEVGSPISVHVLEISDKTGMWEPVGSLAFRQVDGFWLMHLFNGIDNKLFPNSIVELFGAGNRLVEFEGEPLNGFITAGNEPADKAMNKHITSHPAVNISETGVGGDFTWFNDTDKCPDGWYIERVVPRTPTRLIIGCRRPLCSLGVNETVHNITENSFNQCGSNGVMTSLNLVERTMACRDMFFTQESESIGPVIPFVGALSQYQLSDIVTSRSSIRPETWKGTPIQVVEPTFASGKHSLSVYHYGESCFVKFGDASFFLKENTDVVFERGYDKGGRCRGDNEYVTHLQCLNDDCRLGFNMTCQKAPGCKIPTNSHEHVKTNLTYCPSDHVVVGVACVGPSDTSPCSELSLRCAPVTNDPTLRPTINPPGDNTEDTTDLVKIVGAAVGASLGLLALTVLCICFGPQESLTSSEGISTASRVVYEF